MTASTIAIGTGRIRGMCTSGSGTVCSEPRDGRRLPNASRITTTTTNGSTWSMPDCAHVGHQSLSTSRLTTDWNMPSTMEAMHTIQTDSMRATSSTARAGTTSRV